MDGQPEAASSSDLQKEPPSEGETEETKEPLPTEQEKLLPTEQEETPSQEPDVTTSTEYGEELPDDDGPLDEEMVMPLDLGDETQTPLEDNNGLTLRNSVEEVDDYTGGKMLHMTSGWDNQDQGHAIVKNTTPLQGDAFTVLLDFKMDYEQTETALVYRETVFGIGTETKQLRVLASGKLGYGDPTKVGDAGASGETYKDLSVRPQANQWYALALVYNAGKATVYLNGEEALGETEIGFTLKDLTDIQARIARSYATNNLLRGYYDNIVIIDSAATADSAKAETAARAASKAMHEALSTLKLSITGEITEEVSLPDKAGEYSITWSSSDTDVLSVSGTTATPGSKSGTVKLTASVTSGETTVSRDFTVKAVTSADKDQLMLDRLLVPYYLYEGMELPTQDGKITWSSSPTYPDSGISEEQTLTASVTGASDKTKTVTVRAMGKDSSRILGYTKGESDVNASLHLAYSANGSQYEALNSNYGVLFAGADFTRNVKGDIRNLTQPYIFRKKDGGFGVVAIHTGGTNQGKILYFTSDELVQYQEVGLLDADPGKTISNPTCEYDAAAKTYRLGWTGDDGLTYYRTTSDFQTLGEKTQGAVFVPQRPEGETGIASAVIGNIVPVTSEEAAFIESRLGRVYAVSAETTQTVNLETNADASGLRNTRAQVTYSDGSTADKRVNWNESDLAAVDTSIEGTYTVKGSFVQHNFPWPMMTDRADPNVIYWKGKYYFIATDDYQASQFNLYIRSADTLEELKDADAGQKVSGQHGNAWKYGNDQLLWDGISGTIPTDASGGTITNPHTGIHWAPELHEIKNYAYRFNSAGYKM